MKGRTKNWSSVAMAAVLIALSTAARTEDDPAKSLELRLEGACDSDNSHLWLVNNHASKTIVATLRWSLANSKRVATDQFQVLPAAKLEIGCAAKADIVVAQFATP